MISLQSIKDEIYSRRYQWWHDYSLYLVGMGVALIVAPMVLDQFGWLPMTLQGSGLRALFIILFAVFLSAGIVGKWHVALKGQNLRFRHKILFDDDLTDAILKWLEDSRIAAASIDGRWDAGKRLVEWGFVRLEDQILTKLKFPVAKT